MRSIAAGNVQPACKQARYGRDRTVHAVPRRANIRMYMSLIHGERMRAASLKAKFMAVGACLVLAACENPRRGVDAERKSGSSASSSAFSGAAEGASDHVESSPEAAQVMTGPIGSDIGATMAARAANGKVDPFFPVQSGGHPTAPCSAVFDGGILFEGTCTLNTEGPGTSLFSPKDGCTFDVFKKGGATVATLSAYRDACEPVDATGSGGPIDLGQLRRAGNCWVGARVKFCAG